MYRPGGSLWDALVAASPQSELVDEFKDMVRPDLDLDLNPDLDLNLDPDLTRKMNNPFF